MEKEKETQRERHWERERERRWCYGKVIVSSHLKRNAEKNRWYYCSDYIWLNNGVEASFAKYIKKNQSSRHFDLPLKLVRRQDRGRECVRTLDQSSLYWRIMNKNVAFTAANKGS